MAKWYVKLDRDHKTLFWIGMFAFAVLVGLTPLFLLHGFNGVSYPLGWLLGSVAGLLAVLSVFRLPKSVFSYGDSSKNVVLLWLFRIILYVFVLAISALCTFKSAWLGGYSAFNFYTAFLGLFAPFCILGIFRFVSSHKKIRKSA